MHKDLTNLDVKGPSCFEGYYTSESYLLQKLLWGGSLKINHKYFNSNCSLGEFDTYVI